MKLPKFPKFAEVRKLAAVVLGFVAEAVASGLLSGNVEHVAEGVLAVATIAGVYAAPNAKAKGAGSSIGTITAHLKLDATDFHAELAKAAEAAKSVTAALTSSSAGLAAAAASYEPAPVAAPVAPPAPPAAPPAP